MGMTTYDSAFREDEGALMTVKEFEDSVAVGLFVDYDGYGNAVRDGLRSDFVVVPSRVREIPKDATHVLWYNN